ncbi:MAG: Permease of the drug/metabolite transporter (DMT) superfamily [Candidatus Kapaibacterium sp.]|nr:MAG: Permease of the drug/metabolite transporter (DMT) superfamily [Candidatus Kapabacteria bacterium]
MKISLSFWDILIIASYYLLLTFIGFFVSQKSSKKVNESEADYLFAGRKLTLPFFVASLVATWYGNILGIGEFVYRYGLVAWFCFGIVYYFSAFVYALLLSKRIRTSPSQTIAEQIASKFGKTSGVVASIVMLIITFPSVYVLMVGVFVNMFTDLNLFISIIIGTLISFLYIAYGGFKSNIFTNTFQFILMYLGFAIFLYFSLSSVNFDFIKFQELPQSHLKFFGDVSWQFLVTWIFISLQTFVDPSFYQRCTSVKSFNIAQKGIFLSIFFWLIFDSMTIVIGLIAKLTIANIDPLYTYPILLEKVVPTIFKSIVLVSMLATIISTLESYTFLSALIIGKDIFEYFKIGTNLNLKTRIRIGLLFTAISSILIAYLIPSAIDIIYKTSSIAVPSLFYPLLFSFTNRKIIIPKQANIIITSSAIITLLFTFMKEIIKDDYLLLQALFFFEPMVFGFLWSTILTVLFYIVNKRKELAISKPRV